MSVQDFLTHETYTETFSQDNENPFSKAEDAKDESKTDSKPTAAGQSQPQSSQYNMKDRAATVAPEGTAAAEAQRKGEHHV